MNELIAKLYDQALVLESNGDYVAGELDPVKFAELIVRECMDLAFLEQKRYAEFTHRNLSECAVTMSNFRLLMKDHFGVENERD